ncbi:MAG: hypothetical protein AAGG68_09970 [Bacteroidota bacterium]
MLDLEDKKWVSFQGGYGVKYDASILLKKLELTDDKEEIKQILNELFQELYHQHNVGLASYLALPHLIRIGIEKHIDCYEIPLLVASVEIQRKSDNPEILKEYKEEYEREIKGVIELINLNQDWDRNYTFCATAAIAAVNGQTDLAEIILQMDNEDLVEKFEFLLANYDELERIINDRQK